MNFTVRMIGGNYFILENVLGFSSTASGTLVFFSEFNDKVKCTKISSGMKDLVYYRKDVVFIIDNIERIQPYNIFDTDDSPELTKRKEVCCSVIESILSEIVERLRRSLYD